MAEATHEIYGAAASGTYKGHCRICGHTTKAASMPVVMKRIETHVEEVHGKTPVLLR